jgi:hypothetical protein
MDIYRANIKESMQTVSKWKSRPVFIHWRNKYLIFCLNKLLHPHSRREVGTLECTCPSIRSWLRPFDWCRQLSTCVLPFDGTGSCLVLAKGQTAGIRTPSSNISVVSIIISYRIRVEIVQCKQYRSINSLVNLRVKNRHYSQNLLQSYFSSGVMILFVF